MGLPWELARHGIYAAYNASTNGDAAIFLIYQFQLFWCEFWVSWWEYWYWIDGCIRSAWEYNGWIGIHIVRIKVGRMWLGVCIRVCWMRCQGRRHRHIINVGWVRESFEWFDMLKMWWNIEIRWKAWRTVAKCVRIFKIEKMDFAWMHTAVLIWFLSEYIEIIRSHKIENIPCIRMIRSTDAIEHIGWLFIGRFWCFISIICNVPNPRPFTGHLTKTTW